MDIIARTEDLKLFCELASRKQFVTVDTEFIREKTYYAELCLIQLAFAGGSEDQDAVLIDPLSENIDLSPFFQLMANDNVMKVFHAARQDLEIMFSMSGSIPFPFFDTQVAAMVCGFGDQISYDKLVKECVGASIDKSTRFSNWASRPLTKEQCTYALGDVTFLRDVYSVLKNRLNDNGRENWVKEEMDRLSDSKNYFIEPSEAWKRIKIRGGSNMFLAMLRDLAKFREEEAQTRNINRRRILTDEALMEIASKKPSNVAEIQKLRFLPRDSKNNWIGKKIQKIVANVDPEKAPIVDNIKNIQDKKSQQTLVELLKVLLSYCSEKYGVASKIIATIDDLKEIANNEYPKSRALIGWRKEIFGLRALKLKSGNIALSIKHGEVKIISSK